LKKLFSVLVLTLLLASMLTSGLYIQPVKAGGTVGVKAGDWIKCTYTISGWPSGTPYPEWLKVEFLSVEGTNATIRVTMRMSDGTEQSDTMTVDVAAGGGTFQGLSGFVIPANCTTGDSIYMTGYGNVTIAGEATGTYAGASRTVVYASFSQYGTQLTYYWDKQTGVMVEASTISGGVTGTAKATEINMWQAETIYIRADGSVDPPTAPISSFDNVTYTLTGNIATDADGIVVERDNIVVDGAGYTLQGTESGNGIDLHGRTNVTVKNTQIKGFFIGIYLYASSNNSIAGNIITNNAWGIWLNYYCSNNSIAGNNIAGSAGYGISLLESSYNSIAGNNITNNNAGIILVSVTDSSVAIMSNSIHGNNITNNGYGIILTNSFNNSISENNVTNNEYGIYFHESSHNNKLYHNNFIDNTQQAYIDTPAGYANVWDNGYPSGGNYWSDYAGVDADGDGIGDTPYIIVADNQDRYPLLGPFNTFDAGIWNGTTYNVDVVSNSTVSNFQLDASQKSISFNITGVVGLAGFCRVTVPNVIIEDLWQGNYTVLLNGEPWPFRNWTDSTNTYIYINYTHSEHEIVIIPEFPSFLVLPMFMIATLLAVTVHRKKHAQRE